MPPETPQSTKPIPLAFNIFACAMSSVKRELPPSMTRSPLSSRSPSLVMVSWVGGAGGHHHPHVRGASSALTIAAMVAHVGDLGVAVEADDLVTGAAQPLAHVAAHLAETDETELHG